MDIIRVFEKFGLKEDHLKVYKANLEWGETTISNIAYKSRLPRTTVYQYLDDLIKVGLIKQILRDNKKNYVAADPEKLVSMLNDESLDIQKLIKITQKTMSQLKSIQNNRTDKPKVHYLEGEEGIKQAYEMTLEASSEVCIQCYSSNYEKVVKGDFLEDYFKKFFSSDIRSRELITDTESDEEWAKKWGSKKNLQMMVDISTVKNAIETDLMLFDDKVLFVSFNEKNPYALLIEDPDIFNAMKSMFELSWKEAIRSDKRIVRGEKVRTAYED
ncbi:hypothetical protein H6763_03750 [Candidatus Nomurabacteria bacterium]|nr:hypothetical protein [Candidatus Nomurabacteria bacterium]MCB9803919.1 hypothetical protein [Candidatus Nomurabacteria bacterium]